MEAVDPPFPRGSSDWLIKSLHAIMTFPLMPLLPVQSLYSHFGALVATRTVVVALAFNSLLWGCALIGLSKLARSLLIRHNTIKGVVP
jgi:hypothetical protein